MASFKFYLCTFCAHRPTNDEAETLKKCPECGCRNTIKQQFTPEGPYKRTEFADLADRRTVKFVKGDQHLILNRLIATVACGFAKEDES